MSKNPITADGFKYIQDHTYYRIEKFNLEEYHSHQKNAFAVQKHNGKWYQGQVPIKEFFFDIKNAQKTLLEVIDAEIARLKEKVYQLSKDDETEELNNLIADNLMDGIKADYCNDYESIAVARIKMKQLDIGYIFINELADIVLPLEPKNVHVLGNDIDFALMNATPLQQAKAIIKTLGVNKEDNES